MSLDLFGKITQHLSDNLPFVVYRKPQDEDIKGIFQKDDTLNYLSDYTDSGFIFAPFRSEEPTILLRPDQIETQIGPEIQSYTDTNSTPVNSHDQQRAFHMALIEKGLAETKNENLRKVVLSRRLEVVADIHISSIFQRLLLRCPNALCYVWYHPKIGLWAGATPEILLSIRNKRLTTMSLAGTQSYHGNDNPIWQKKELEEQQMVTDYIWSALKGKVSGLRQMPRESIRAGGLMHLRTKITANMESNGLESILKSLHPTPAVCGLPKQAAKAFILKNENYHREFYTGYLGELNISNDRQRSTRKANTENRVYRSRAKETTLFVNLRCAKLKIGKAHIYIGGGITKDSQPQKEWEETVAKSQTMLNILSDT